MVSHYDCAKQHNLRQFNLLNVEQCTEAPSDIKHASVKARVYVRAKAKHIKAFKCVAYAIKERKICFQGSVKYHRVDRTVRNHDTLPLPVTLDPLECKIIIRHLIGTNVKILNNLQYNKTLRRSLLSRTIRTISNSFYCIPIEQNVYRYFYLYACRQKLDI